MPIPIAPKPIGGTTMPLYGWDSSHYDGHLTKAILQRAADEGIAFWTHKLGEGLDNTDPYAAEAFANAWGIFPVVGGYYFIHHGQDMVAQAQRCIALADKVAAGWRDFAGWFFQTDAESESPYGLPTLAEVKLFSDTLAAESGRKVIIYASAGQYGNRLSGIGWPLWNAHYGTNPHGDFKTIYPGDNSAGWTAFSGQTPQLLQYGSNATIAGLLTCDVNAFRGTLDELLELIGGTMPFTGADASTAWQTDGIIDNRSWRADATSNPKIRPAAAVQIAMDEAHAASTKADQILAGLAAAAKVEGATLAAVTALAAHGGNADTAVIVAAINAVGAEESKTVAALQAQLAATNTRLAAALTPPTAPATKP